MRSKWKRKLYFLMNPRSEVEESDEKDCEDENKSSHIQTFWNIFNANQGVAVLTMPFVVKCGGWLALLSIAGVAVISNYTNKILVSCLYDYNKNGERYRARSSYLEIGDAFSGRYGRTLVHFAQIFEQMSYCTLLLILSGSILEKSFPHMGLQRSDWTAVAAIMVLPNVLLKSVTDVSWVSFLAVLIGQVVYTILTGFCLWHLHRWETNAVPEFDISQYGVAVGIIVVSYASQPYMPAIEDSMTEPSRFPQVINVAYLAITGVKMGFGIIGFLTFQDQTKQVITRNIPHGFLHLPINVLVLGLALSSYTIPVYTVFDLLQDINTSWFPLATLLEGSDRLTQITLITLRCFVISLTLLTGVIIPHFGLYMALVGNFTGMCLAFIFPAIFHMKICYDRLEWHHFTIDTLVALFGIFGAAIGCHFSILALLEAYKDD
ncbi:vesicular inhibitory amino acid transporter-like [Xenia sp. Carnegie-2017]|uniref:vesicular inhibitory amino acid transporter-like n=1 Tax=Xenia sp. Carnegie-2017 TaxID=2897299 RepID=UPI001F038E13|nr:vesicular inhibitory amino acid transporter-like [Xenia sp. Carnegie-2017]XP_046842300.1 vesicular inhibitory amino acid transporter-like [Xenia sp. Carnegie-2017]